MSRLLAAVLVVGITTIPERASAHAVGLSRGTYSSIADAVSVEIAFQNGELAAMLPSADPDHDGRLDASELGGSTGTIPLSVTRGTAPCAGALTTTRLIEEDGVAATGLFECPPGAEPMAVHLDFLDATASGHRHMASLTASGTTTSALAYGAERTLFLTGSAPAEPTASLFWLGVEHVLTGVDHLVFIVGLVLVRARFRTLALIITAFTVGHSISLAVSTLGVWVPSAAWVEPAIALSIAYIGLENLVAKDLSGRWRLTLAFGLIHGFGFAGALRDLDLPSAEVPMALLSFNLGVEAGQLAAVVPVLGLLAAIRHRPWFDAVGARAASQVVVALGLFWFVARIVP